MLPKLNKINITQYFELKGLPADQVITQGQREIFNILVKRPVNRVNIISCTQYGKSEIVAMACVWISCIQGKLISVVAPTNEKAKIIMRYYVNHLGDHPIFASKLEKDTKLDRLRQEETKERIILNNRGGLYVISCQASSPAKGIEAAMGAGADILILDEGGLVPDGIESTVYRMIAGRGGDGFYCKIGNPFYRNHFLTSSESPNYHQIFIDYNQALAEGRYDQAFIEEAKTKPLFDVLYECKFPDEKLIDDRGYRLLMLEAEWQKSLIEKELEPVGKPRLGVDVGRGVNKTVYVLRYDNYAIILARNTSRNLMDQVKIVAEFKEKFKIKSSDIYIDDTGVGGGVVDRLEELDILVNAVRVGNPAVEKDKFKNIKAENFWLMRDWIINGGKLVNDDAWGQLREVRFKEDSSSKLKMEPKEDLQKRGIESPDEVDALMLTFSNEPEMEFGFM